LRNGLRRAVIDFSPKGIFMPQKNGKLGFSFCGGFDTAKSTAYSTT
jgi:hypothetical protein